MLLVFVVHAPAVRSPFWLFHSGKSSRRISRLQYHAFGVLTDIISVLSFFASSDLLHVVSVSRFTVRPRTLRWPPWSHITAPDSTTSQHNGSFSAAFRPMAPQPSRSNVADPGIVVGSVPCFLSCLLTNGPTAHPFGPALQALNFLGLHSVTCVSCLFPFDFVSASTHFSRFRSHHCARWSCPSWFVG